MHSTTRTRFSLAAALATLLATSLACSLFGADKPATALPEEAPSQVSETEAPPAEAPAPTSSPAGPTRTAIPTRPSLPPTPTMPPGPTPEPGTGNLMGRIIWNSQGVAGNPVILCEEISYDFGCLGEKREAETDEYGVYVFANLPPGEYALATKSVDTDGGWLYVTSGFTASAKFPVESGETLNAGDLVLTKTDVVLLSPGDREKIDDPRPTLKWEAYPEAASYVVTLKGEYAYAVVDREWVESNEYQVEEDLLNCEYFWFVDVYNAYQEKIVDGTHGSKFYVEDQPISCELEGLSPAHKSSVQGPKVTLSWDAHPLAAYYELWFAEGEWGGGEIIANHVKMTETSYSSPDLKPGIYTWQVSVFDAAGDQLAGMEFRNLTVK